MIIYYVQVKNNDITRAYIYIHFSLLPIGAFQRPITSSIITISSPRLNRTSNKSFGGERHQNKRLLITFGIVHGFDSRYGIR